jgi:hypothetical protein
MTAYETIMAWLIFNEIALAAALLPEVRRHG